MTDVSIRRLFVCVYRRHIPREVDWQRTNEAATGNSHLKRFLATYWDDASYFDWGDDPGFFCALDLIGDARHASWSVCRRDVRNSIQEGESIAFFVFKPAFREDGGRRHATGRGDYYYIGCGTVGRRVDRNTLWRDDAFKQYRDFFNVLARVSVDRCENVELFHPCHKDWTRRAAAPVVLFVPERSSFELYRPHHVAHIDSVSDVPEIWHDDATSKKLEHLLFGDGRARRLRTSSTGFQHTARVIRGSSKEIGLLVDELCHIAKRTVA
jgi:hypothetical protein